MNKKIILSSKISNIAEVENFLDNLTQEIVLSDFVYGNVIVSVLEAFTNAVIHGNDSDPSKFVTIEVETVSSELKISISDQGKGFDYLTIPDPTIPENIENIDGRGVFLMKKLADDVSFEKDGSTAILSFFL
jgi:serine/threonine-protein kinase RsbW